MGIEGICTHCGGRTWDYECLRCIRRERDAALEKVAELEKAAEGGLRIVCDNAYHDRGSGVCSFCVQKRIDMAIQPYQDALNKIHDLAGQMGDIHPHVGAIQAWVHEVSPCEGHRKV